MEVDEPRRAAKKQEFSQHLLKVKLFAPVPVTPRLTSKQWTISAVKPRLTSNTGQ